MSYIGRNGPVTIPAGSFDFNILRQSLDNAVAGGDPGRDIRVFDALNAARAGTIYVPIGFDFTTGATAGLTIARAGPGWIRDGAGAVAQVNANLPRYNHVWHGGAWVASGLLYETHAATNQQIHSDDVSVIDAAVYARLGGMTTPAADLLVETAGVGVSPALQVLYDVIAGATYYFSAEVSTKAGSAKRYIAIQPARNIPSDPRRSAIFDVDVGLVTAVRYPGIGNIDPASATSWRIGMHSVGASLSVAGNHVDFIIAGDPLGANGLPSQYTADGTGGFHVSHIQIEQDRQSSYIPTTGAAVTRPAETATLDWGSKGVPDGAHDVIFEGMSAVAIVTVVVAGGTAVIPALPFSDIQSAYLL